MLVVFASCQQGKINQMQATQDSLTQAAEEKDSAIVSFVSAMTEIQKNLESIKRLEDIVRIESAKVGEGVQTDKEQILSDIETIHQLLKKNKELIDQLQKKLGSSNAKVAELQRAIVVLKRQVELKDAEIAELNAEVQKLYSDIADLNSRIEEMTAENMRKDEDLQAKTSAIESQTIAINTAFYAFGSRKELIVNDLVEKAGGFLGVGSRLEMKKDFNRSYFTKIDIREFSGMELHAAKARLVTPHPSGSYHFEGVDLVERIVIDDPDKFWQTSKYLIIEVN